MFEKPRVVPIHRHRSALHGARIFFSGSVVEYDLDGDGESVGGHIAVSPQEGEVSIGAWLAMVSIFISLPTRRIHQLWPKLVRVLKIPVESVHDDVNIIRASIHDESLFWDILHPGMSWRTSTPRWRHGNVIINPLRRLLGRHKVRSEKLAVVPVTIPLPEGDYSWNVTLFREHHKSYERMPFTTIRYTWNAEAAPGNDIPEPGKGTTAYNIDEDALSAASGPGRSEVDAITSIFATVMRQRIKYGSGFQWRPTRGPHAEDRDTESGIGTLTLVEPPSHAD